MLTNVETMNKVTLLYFLLRIQRLLKFETFFARKYLKTYFTEKSNVLREMLDSDRKLSVLVSAEISVSVRISVSVLVSFKLSVSVSVFRFRFKFRFRSITNAR
jgi:hypothetical protein